MGVHSYACSRTEREGALKTRLKRLDVKSRKERQAEREKRLVIDVRERKASSFV